MLRKRILLLLTLLIGASLCQALPEKNTNSEVKFLANEEAKLSNFNLNASDAELFIQGYFSGLELFNNLLANSTCLQNGEVIVEDTLKLYEILKDFHIDTSIIGKIRDIIVATKSIISSFNGEVEACKAAADLALNDIHRLVDRVRKDNYLEELGSHLVFHLNEVKGLIASGFAQFHEGDMLNAGLNFGKATKFVAFWDL